MLREDNLIPLSPAMLQEMSISELRVASSQLRALGAVATGDVSGALAIALEVEEQERKARGGAAGGTSTHSTVAALGSTGPVTATGAILLQQVLAAVRGVKVMKFAPAYSCHSQTPRTGLD